MERDDSLAIFVEETREQIQTMEEYLLEADQHRDDESLNTIFRSAHTVKGSAGIFAFDTIVNFTHHFEHILDLLRKHKIEFESELISLLLKCNDHLSFLMDLVENDEIDDYEANDSEGDLIEQLATYDPDFAPSPSQIVKNTTSDDAVLNNPSFNSSWHLSIRFDQNLFKNGIDLFSIISFLEEQGQIVSLALIDDNIPDWNDFDAEQCYLGLEIDFDSNYKDEKEAATQLLDSFGLILDEGSVEILPPFADLASYAQLLVKLPEPMEYLGAIWTSNYTLSFDEWEILDRPADEQDIETPAPITSNSDKAASPSPPLPKTEKTSATASTSKKKPKQFVKVDAEKLDHLINLVGELVIGESRAKLLASEQGDTELVEVHELVSSLIEMVRDGSLALRMVPLSIVFSRFPRMIRDISNELGKQVKLTIIGEETAVDRSMVESVSDPLMHLLRNAIDHGLEMPDERASANKNPEGEIQINAFHSSGSVTIEIKDDGKGLDKERIRRKAIEKGIITEDDKLSNSEIYDLIFAPGFSTAEAVTNLSGRGVGLDVVKKNISAMRGQIKVSSNPGIGSTFSIKLPLTLSIIDGFLVSVGNEKYVLPMEFIDECFEFKNSHSLPDSGCINLRKEALPYVRLRSLLGADSERPKRENVVVVRLFENRYGIVVDDLLGEIQVVIKSIQLVSNSLPIMSGATVMGDGSISVVLDIPSVIELVRKGQDVSPAA